MMWGIHKKAVPIGIVNCSYNEDPVFYTYTLGVTVEKNNFTIPMGVTLFDVSFKLHGNCAYSFRPYPNDIIITEDNNLITSLDDYFIVLEFNLIEILKETYNTLTHEHILTINIPDNTFEDLLLYELIISDNYNKYRVMIINDWYCFMRIESVNDGTQDISISDGLVTTSHEECDLYFNVTSNTLFTSSVTVNNSDYADTVVIVDNDTSLSRTVLIHLYKNETEYNNQYTVNFSTSDISSIITEDGNFIVSETEEQLVRENSTRLLTVDLKQLGMQLLLNEITKEVQQFAYTGSVQSTTLTPGKYKLQVWGAQGGSSNGYYVTGGKGGYSEGVLSTKKDLSVFVFVGGAGSTETGGMNGGGGTSGSSHWDSDNYYGISYPAAGGGGTDICTVNSTMGSGSNNRSNESWLSRFIVAGGGSGSSSWDTEELISDSSENLYHHSSSSVNFVEYSSTSYPAAKAFAIYPIGSFSAGDILITNYSADVSIILEGYYNNGSGIGGSSGSNYTLSNDYDYLLFMVFSSSAADIGKSVYFDVYTVEIVDNSYTEYDYGYGASYPGGGIRGLGAYAGTLNSAGNGGGFGYGAKQSTTNYRFVSGGAGGGWYGGGTTYSDTDTIGCDGTGGGSGFVNTADNALYRPSGYTGLELDSGTTIAGNTTFPSISGNTETGHSGNGYAIITKTHEFVEASIDRQYVFD